MRQIGENGEKPDENMDHDYFPAAHVIKISHLFQYKLNTDRYKNKNRYTSPGNISACR
jgi:hypothetical protein